jgi:hypothetical protein
MHEIEQRPICSKRRMINSETYISGVTRSLSRRCTRGHCNGDGHNNADPSGPIRNCHLTPSRIAWQTENSHTNS